MEITRLSRWKLMRWRDKHDVGYIIGLARNAVLERLARPWTQVSTARFTQTNQEQRLFGEFVYGAETWDRQRRVIVKAEHLDQGPNSRFIVTDRILVVPISGTEADFTFPANDPSKRAKFELRRRRPACRQAGLVG